MMSSFSASNSSNFMPYNYTTKSYRLAYDEEEKVDSILDINGEQVKLMLTGTKNFEWNGNVLKTLETSTTSDFATTQIFEFDANSNIVRAETLLNGTSDEVMDLMNEKMVYSYDNKNRITKIQLFKNTIENGKTVMNAVYDDTSELPISAEIDMMAKMKIDREPITDGYKYHFKMEIPQELIDMARDELGSNATDDEVMNALGAFGKIPKKYSDVTFGKDGTIQEDVYEENQEVADKMELVSKIVFDKNFNILNQNDFESGDIISTIVYEYTDMQKVKSIKKDENEKKINEFDKNGNITKEYTELGYLLKNYRNERLTEVREYTDFDELISYEVYHF
ncbi:MAG: hypothetical protein R2774_07990 [Saprospiraceae bacterium]